MRVFLEYDLIQLIFWREKGIKSKKVRQLFKIIWKNKNINREKQAFLRETGIYEIDFD